MRSLFRTMAVPGTGHTANREARKFARSRLLRRSVELTRRLGLNDCLRTGLPTGETD